VATQQAALHRKLKGHYAYYGITGNGHALARFLYEVRSLWRKWLDRRSWHARMTWEKFGRLSARYPLPQPRVVHSIYLSMANYQSPGEYCLQFFSNVPFSVGVLVFGMPVTVALLILESPIGDP
jgi:hypothetical protein